MQSSADVVIVGAGIVGCATAYYLAKQGVHVTVCDKGTIAGEQSSRNWGFVRQQGRDPLEVPLMIECNRMWQGLEAELGADLEWRQGGNLALAANEQTLALYEGWLEIARQYQLATRILTNRELRDLVPGLAVDYAGGLYTPGDGQAEPAKVAPAFAAAARALGADVRERCAVEHIETAAGAVASVRTEVGEIRTNTVVVAAGAWSSKLLRGIGLSLPQLLIRATVARTAPLRPITAAGLWGPEVALRQRRDGTVNLAAGTGTDHDIVPDTLRYFRAFLPNYRENRNFIGVRLGRPFLREFITEIAGQQTRRQMFKRTRTLDPEPDPKWIRRAVAGLRRMFPDLQEVPVTRSWGGVVDVTPDAIPVLGSVDSPRGLVLATGFSGHGFGMGPIAGRVTAEVVATGKSSFDISGFRFRRFADGTMLGPRSVL